MDEEKLPNVPDSEETAGEQDPASPSSVSRRTLIQAGWAVPMILAVGLPTKPAVASNHIDAHADRHHDNHSDGHVDTASRLAGRSKDDSHGDSHADSHVDNHDDGHADSSG